MVPDFGRVRNCCSLLGVNIPNNMVWQFMSLFYFYFYFVQSSGYICVLVCTTVKLASAMVRCMNSTITLTSLCFIQCSAKQFTCYIWNIGSSIFQDQDKFDPYFSSTNKLKYENCKAIWGLHLRSIKLCSGMFYSVTFILTINLILSNIGKHMFFLNLFISRWYPQNVRQKLFVIA